VIVPARASVVSVSLFLVRQDARSIPDEISEAARLDERAKRRIFSSTRLRAPAVETDPGHAGDLHDSLNI